VNADKGIRGSSTVSSTTDASSSKHDLLAAEETVQQIYETISDKPEKMVKYENAPRPTDQ
jgi:hypothetical protein